MEKRDRYREVAALAADEARLAHNCTPRQKTHYRVEIQMHAGRTNKTKTAAKNAGRAGWGQDSTAAGQEAGNMVRIGRKSPKMQVTLEQAPSDRDIRSPDQSHGDRKAQKDVPAHDDTDVRTILEGKEPRKGEGTRRNEDAFDSLDLWEERAVEGLVHHTSARDKDVMETPSVGSHGEVADSWGLDLASAFPAAAHVPHRWLVEDLAADKGVGHRRVAGSAQRFSSAGRQYGRGRKQRHVLRRA